MEQAVIALSELSEGCLSGEATANLEYLWLFMFKKEQSKRIAVMIIFIMKIPSKPATPTKIQRNLLPQ